jgi:hypothetical protein
MKTRERLPLSMLLEEETGDESKIDPVALLNSTGKSGIHKFETACLLAPFLICIPLQKAARLGALFCRRFQSKQPAPLLRKGERRRQRQ